MSSQLPPEDLPPNPPNNSPPVTPAPRLTDDERRALGIELAQLVQTELPLADGLRAAAAETPSRRLSTAMQALAERLDRGVALDDAMRQSPGQFPPYFVALVTAGLRSGSLADVLLEFIEYRRRWAEQGRLIWRAVAYPLVILSFAGLLFAFVALYLFPPIQVALVEFRVDLPPSTRAMIWLSEGGLLGTAGSVAVIVGLFVLFHKFGGHWLGHTVLRGVPLLGMLWRLGSWSEFTSMVGLLLQHGVALPEALRLTSETLRDDRLSKSTLQLAARTGQGQALSDAAVGLPGVPQTLLPVLRWGEDRSALAAAFQTAGEMFATRLELQAQLIRIIAVPVTFLFIMALIGFTITAMFAPFLDLIRMLT